ncbi:MAG: MBL fold metallo-hydrolase [Clostridia bacterium]|nr:MBL fold metallo-hydrolase [Clostridia bacterium]
MKKLLCLLLCLMALSMPALAEDASPVMQVHQMMIGCADGYLIRCGDVNIMIDGGNANPNKPTDEVLEYLHASGIDTLDVYIVTHWHLDHCMNLNKVLAEFGDADTVVYSPSPALHEDYNPLAHGTYQQMKMGDVLEIGGMTFTCIGPEKLTQNGRGNPDSLNFVLQYGQRKILFTGDFAHSKMINSTYKELCSGVDVLKFPHHAIQPYEIGKQAIRTVRPQWVIVPGVAGKHTLWDFFDDNGVKFPKENVLTNADGHVVILTDGGEYFEIRTQVALDALPTL